MRSIEFRIIWNSMLWHVVTRGAVRGCPNSLFCISNIVMLRFESMHMSLSLFHIIFSCHVCYFVIISLFLICCPIFTGPNRASYNTLMKLCQIISWLITCIWHILNLMLQIPLKKKSHAIRSRE